MPMQELPVTTFDGGFQPDGQPGTLLENQWSELSGFVFDRERKVRSQWAEQLVDNSGTWVWVEAFVGNAKLWLIAMDNTGAVHFAEAPADGADATTAAATTFTSLVSISTDKRPIGLVLQDLGSGVVNALMVCKQGSTDIDFFYENATGDAILHATVTDVYPDDPTPVTDELGETGYENLDATAIPTANVAAMWGDQLVLADVTVKVDAAQPLSGANATRGRNALWVSEPGNYDTFNPTTGIAYIASQEATIIGMVEVDLGLLVFTTVADRSYDGVLLLRGSPVSYEVVSLRAGVGPAVELVYGNGIPQTGPHVAFWPEVGSVVFAGAEGGIWHTQGEGVDRLDHYGPDRYPADLSTDDWYCVGFREQVIVSRPDGVHCLRVFEEAGAWTKLVTGSGGRPTWMAVGYGSCYWIDSTSGAIRRWAPDVHAERGMVDGAESVTLTATTRTIQGSGHSTTWWHRIGVVASSPEGTGDLLNVVSRDSAFDAAAPGELTTAVNAAVGDRLRLTVPAHGPSIETTVTTTWTGDVVFEGVTLMTRSGRVER